MANAKKGRLVMGYWSCPYCETKNIKGNFRNCPNCGKARDNSTTFYLNPLKIEYASEEENRTVNRNPDWICTHCQQLNSDNNTRCISCGSVRGSENSTYSNFNHYAVTKAGNIESNIKPKTNHEDSVEESIKDNIRDIVGIKTNRYRNAKTNNFSNFISNYKMPIFSIILILLLIAGLVFLFSPRYYDVKITGFSWERNIIIEKWQTVNESDWTLPTNARLHYSRQEFSHYRQVLDHYETETRQVARQRVSHYEDYVSGYRDLGNGYFEEVISSRPVYETYYETETYQQPVYRDEPVYRTKYYYEIDKWLYERTVTTKDNNKEPCWGETNLSSVERIARKDESYQITVLNLKNEETKCYTISYEEWLLLELEQITKLKVTLGHAELLIEDKE